MDSSLQNTMLAAFLTCFIMACQPSYPIDAEGWIHYAIEHHGGLEKYERIKEISYTKRVLFYDSLGEIESDISERHHYQLKPELAGSIRWTIDSTAYEISYEKGRGFKSINGVEAGEADHGFLAAYYTLFQPFKLADPGLKFTDLGEINLDNGRLSRQIKISYPLAIKSDTWWYYLDPETGRVLANQVDHGKGFSYIKNLDYQEVEGMVFNAHRKSFTTKGTPSSDLLRAEYFLSDFKIDFED